MAKTQKGKGKLDAIAKSRTKNALRKTNAKIKADKAKAKRDYNLALGANKGRTARHAAAVGAITSAAADREKTIRQQSSDRAAIAQAAINKWNGVVSNTPETDVDSGSAGQNQTGNTGKLDPTIRW